MVVRLMLIDDQEMVRVGLRTLLETHEDFCVVAEANNATEAIEKAQTCQPDVIVLEIDITGMDGPEIARQLKNLCPQCCILTLTANEDKQAFFDMLSAGASGYLTKLAASEEFVAAIRAVAEGNMYLQPSLARWLLDDYRRLSIHFPHEFQIGEDEEAMADLEKLSHREIQVLRLVAQGLSTPQISDSLEISPKTVSRHRERIMNKLQIHSVTGLVKFAVRAGLIQAR